MKSHRESGFAMLLVLAMASVIAISLYMTLPRIAFETQRDREQLLIDRGHEYQRGIQLYVRKFKKFPSKIEDLENSNGTRFLRRQYIDPLTGKSEWRIIHAGPGGALLDSKVQTQKDKDKKVDEKSVNTYITELQSIGSAPQADSTVNLALRRRPSDQTPAGGPETNNNNGNQIGPLPPDISQNTPPPQTSQIPAAPSVVYPPGSYPPGVTPPQPPTGIPGQGTLVGPVQAVPEGYTINAQGVAINPATGAPVGIALPGQPFPNRGAQVQAGQQTSPGATTAAGPATPANAAQLIGNLLTNPRPGGAPGQTQTAATTGQVVRGGIAGVASKAKGEGIKVFNDQTEYEKWEFVYDLSKDTGMTGNGTGLTPNTNQSKPTGAQPGMGTNSPPSAVPVATQVK